MNPASCIHCDTNGPGYTTSPFGTVFWEVGPHWELNNGSISWNSTHPPELQFLIFQSERPTPRYSKDSLKTLPHQTRPVANPTRQKASVNVVKGAGIGPLVFKVVNSKGQIRRNQNRLRRTELDPNNLGAWICICHFDAPCPRSTTDI